MVPRSSPAHMEGQQVTGLRGVHPLSYGGGTGKSFLGDEAVQRGSSDHMQGKLVERGEVDMQGGGQPLSC